MTTILGVRWFSGRATIGVVRVQTEYDEIKYYIGVGSGRDEDEDVQSIASWGTKFPTLVGNVLFGVKGDESD
jgi:hypothetical protein